MKRAWLFVAAIGGLAVGVFFLLHGSNATGSDVWETLQSWFHKFTQKADTLTKEATSDKDVAYSKALDMIAGFESFSAKAYPDADGFSIGYGHFIREGDPYDATSVISESDAWTLLEQDGRGAQNCVAANVTVPLTSNQEAALISLTYNIGCGAFRSSTMLQKVNASDFAGAAAEFSRWTHSGGQVLQALVDRRAQEAGVFQS